MKGKRSVRPLLVNHRLQSCLSQGTEQIPVRRGTKSISLLALVLAEVLSSDSVHIHDALLGERLAHSDG